MDGKQTKEKFRPNPLGLLAGWLFRSLLLSVVVEFAAMIFHNQITEIYLLPMKFWWLRDLLEYPGNLLLAAVIALIWILFRVRTVTVSNQAVAVRGVFTRKHVYSFLEYTFDFEKRLGNKYLKYNRVFLRIQGRDGRKREIELPYYSESTYSDLLSAVNAAVTESIPKEIRNDISYENIMEEGTDYGFPYESVRKNEWERLGMFLKPVGIAFALVLLLVFLDEGWFTYYLLILVGVMVLSIPIEIIRLVRNLARCPRSIRKEGYFFFIDNMGFPVNRVKKIRMTDPKAVSNSIYPKNRYITIYSSEGKYRYFLGSTYSLNMEYYQFLCQELETLFIQEAKKVYYK